KETRVSSGNSSRPQRSPAVIQGGSTMRPSPRIFALLVCLALAAPIGRGQTQVSTLVKASAAVRAGNGSLSRSVVPAAQTRISAVLGREQLSYHATPKADGFRVENSGQGISAEFRSSGMALRNASGRWGMRLARYGYPAAMHDAKSVRPHAEANRIEYSRGGLNEWYLNGPLGLEQGFTLSRTPGKTNGPLTLALTLSGNLTATLDPGAVSLTLRNRGAAVARYSGLTAIDASGRELPAWLELADNQLAIRVDDSRAKYPITVDPYVQAAVLTPTDSNALSGSGDVEAVSVSSDGSTIVVGAPSASYQAEGDNVGTAYVFVKPGTGWANTSSFAAELTYSDRHDDVLFGESVAVSGDGNTVVVGSETSVAYVYVSSGSGWGSGCTAPCVLTESSRLTLTGFEATTVALSGDGNTIAVGGAGNASLFVKPSGGWASSSPLDATNTLGGALGFGSYNLSLSADGNILVGGAANADIGGNFEQGEVEGFFTTDRWLTTPGVHSCQLTASDGAANDGLGIAVGISGDGTTVVAGAETVGGASFPGAAYVFVRPGTDWGGETETAKLLASESTYLFGNAVGISGDGATVVIGDFGSSFPSSAGNALYAFVRPASGWASSSALHQTAKVQPGAIARNGLAISNDSATIVAANVAPTFSPDLRPLRPLLSPHPA